ncbi:MAG TPA: hypothetical protein VIM69_00490 [Opitutaceae bacterium]
MRSRLSLFTLLLAWLLATGSQWEILQVFAWGSMITQSMRQESFSSAVEDTFDGKTPCALCKIVSAVKKQMPTSEQSSEQEKQFKVFLISFAPEGPRMAPLRNCIGIVDTHVGMRSALRNAPPVPPPRA